MATIGQALTAPEAGWARYDDAHKKITYTNFVDGGSNNNNFYKNTLQYGYEDGNSVKFKFTGTKIRIISRYYPNYSANVSIKIDGVSESFSVKREDLGFQVLAFEKTGLQNIKHEVEISNLDIPNNFLLDAIDIDSDGIFGDILMGVLVLSSGEYKKYVDTSWQAIASTSPTEADYLNGNTLEEVSLIPESAWQQLTGDVELCCYTDETSVTEARFNIETEPFTLADELGSTFRIIEYTDNPSQESSSLTLETEPFSVYDYISEAPEVVVYTESTDDITVSTTTEPFDLYDEFGDEVEVLYYTDDETTTEADLILDANWSPVDELQGDFEVVTWTDEATTSTQRVLELAAIPKPQFIRLVHAKKVYGALDAVTAIGGSTSYRDETRYLLASSNEAATWYRWNNITQKFVTASASTKDLVYQNGMTHAELSAITEAQWRTWPHELVGVGMYLKDNPRDTIVSIVDSLSYQDFLPRNTPTIENTSLYILNTTARIDLQMIGSTIFGTLDDDDRTNVQYRIILDDDKYYFPTTGEFTKLAAPPTPIAIELKSSDIKMNDWNTVKVEFKDAFGTVDYWSTSFIGTYNGLMFKDLEGEYYSSEIGDVLKYLDFGTLYAGQTSIEHEIILRNQYGYDVEALQIAVNNDALASGMRAELSKSGSSFEALSAITFNQVIKDKEEISFFIRLKTDTFATPEGNGYFNIVARANKV